jgi:hypothetical protein
MLYQEAVRPILERRFPGLNHSAALLGPGSDAAGFDTEQSMDHDWGPRLQLFLSEADHPAYHAQIHQILAEELPHTIHGFPIDMATHLNHPTTGDPASHHVAVLTVRPFIRDLTTIDVGAEITPIDWVLAPQQQLRTATAGRVFFDGLDELETARAKLAYYPRDVWLYLLAAQWMRISQEEHFMGRTGQVGDETGSRIIATRLIKDLMNLGFLMEHRYAPYIKWFGSAFARLDCASELNPLFEQVFAAPTWQERQSPLVAAYEVMARRHNALGITPPLSTEATFFASTRPFLVIYGGRFAEALRGEIHDPRVLALPVSLGGVDQVIDSTDSYNHLNWHIAQIKAGMQAAYVGKKEG